VFGQASGVIVVVAVVAVGMFGGPMPLSAQTPGVPQQAPAGTTSMSVQDMHIEPDGEVIQPVRNEPTSATASDPSVVTVDTNYSSLTNTWSIDYQCKKAGVAIITITYKNGGKGVVLIGCGARFPLQTVDYTKGMYNSRSYLAWTDAHGTLVVKGIYQQDGKDQPFEFTVPGFSAAAPAPASPKPAPPTKPASDHGGE
jgi:hypothetical protein